MDTLTCIVGVFLFLWLGFLQVPGALNGDSSTLCAIILLKYCNVGCKDTKNKGKMSTFAVCFNSNLSIMVRKAGKKDIQAIIELLHQVDMVHHVIRPDLFKPNTTKYNELELEALLDDESKPIFVFDDGQVLGHAFCMVT